MSVVEIDYGANIFDPATIPIQIKKVGIHRYAAFTNVDDELDNPFHSGIEYLVLHADPDDLSNIIVWHGMTGVSEYMRYEGPINSDTVFRWGTYEMLNIQTLKGYGSYNDGIYVERTNVNDGTIIGVKIIETTDEKGSYRLIDMSGLTSTSIVSIKIVEYNAVGVILPPNLDSLEKITFHTCKMVRLETPRELPILRRIKISEMTEYDAFKGKCFPQEIDFTLLSKHTSTIVLKEPGFNVRCCPYLELTAEYVKDEDGNVMRVGHNNKY